MPTNLCSLKIVSTNAMLLLSTLRFIEAGFKVPLKQSKVSNLPCKYGKRQAFAEIPQRSLLVPFLKSCKELPLHSYSSRNIRLKRAQKRHSVSTTNGVSTLIYLFIWPHKYLLTILEIPSSSHCFSFSLVMGDTKSIPYLPIPPH